MTLFILQNLIFSSLAKLFIECEYVILSLTTLDHPYTCEAIARHAHNCNVGKLLSVKTSDANAVVVGVTKNHLPSKGNDHVDYFRLMYEELGHFPEELENFFPNLIGLRIYKSGLKEVSKEDLRPYPQLKLLALDENEIEVLEENLFEQTPNLQWIYFDDNNIVHIAPKLLGSLSQLQWAYFSGNLCIDENAINSMQVHRLTLKMSAKCPPTVDMMIEIFQQSNLEIVTSLKRLESRVGELERWKRG